MGTIPQRGIISNVKDPKEAKSVFFKFRVAFKGLKTLNLEVVLEFSKTSSILLIEKEFTYRYAQNIP